MFRALLIGINYEGTKSKLSGCINDVLNVKHFLESFISEEIEFKMMTDNTVEKPTRENIINAFQWLITGVKEGDQLFLHYSGHGGWVPDRQRKNDKYSVVGDEEDGRDETLVPLDFQKNGMIVDDEIRQRFINKIPKGVVLYILLDCCHSATTFDLRFTYRFNGPIKSKTLKHISIKSRLMQLCGKCSKNKFSKNNVQVKVQVKDQAKQLQSKKSKNKPPKITEYYIRKYYAYKATKGQVIIISGCQDKQYSSDAYLYNPKKGKYEFQGAMTNAFLYVMNKNPNIKCYKLIREMRKYLKQSYYEQIPQLSSGRLLDLDKPLFAIVFNNLSSQ